MTQKDFSIHDTAGAECVEIGFDENENEVSWKFACTLEVCNCEGSWITGSQNRAVRFESKYYNNTTGELNHETGCKHVGGVGQKGFGGDSPRTD